MDPALVLFILRLLSAALLLGFVALLAWLIIRDLRATEALVAEQGRPQGWLRVLESDDGELSSGDVFPLLPVTSIGRAPGNIVVLTKAYTSAEHALVSRRGRQWWIEDLASRNGTWLNGVKLDAPAVISPGDVVRIGGTELKLELASSADGRVGNGR